MRDLPLKGSKRAVRIGATAALGAFVLIATASSCLAQARTFDCLLEPRLKIKLATPIAGVLKEVPVDRGDVIHKGDVLARLESGVEKALLDLAEARAESDASIKSREASRPRH